MTLLIFYNRRFRHEPNLQEHPVLTGCHSLHVLPRFKKCR